MLVTVVAAAVAAAEDQPVVLARRCLPEGGAVRSTSESSVQKRRCEWV